MSIKKGQKIKVLPTSKQKEVFKLVQGGSPMYKAVKEVYSSTYNPTIIKHTKGWQMLLKKYVKDEKLVKVLNEGLDAGKRVFKNNNETGEVEDMGMEADYAVRHKYLETGLKLKGHYPKEGNQTNVQVNINKFKDYE